MESVVFLCLCSGVNKKVTKNSFWTGTSIETGFLYDICIDMYTVIIIPFQQISEIGDAQNIFEYSIRIYNSIFLKRDILLLDMETFKNWNK